MINDPVFNRPDYEFTGARDISELRDTLDSVLVICALQLRFFKEVSQR